MSGESSDKHKHPEGCKPIIVESPAIYVPRDGERGRPLTIDIYINSMDELVKLARTWCEPIFHTGYLDKKGVTHEQYMVFHGRLRAIYRES